MGALGGVGANPKVDPGNLRTARSSADQISKAKGIEYPGAMNRNVSAPSAPEATTKLAPATTPATTTPTPAKPVETIARPMTPSDIVSHILRLQQAPTAENKQIMMSLIEHGLEASLDNFSKMQDLTRGKEAGRALQTASTLLTRGLDSPKSFDTLHQFLATNPKFAAQVEQAQQTVSVFRASLQNAQTMFAAGLFAGLTSVMSEWDTTLKKWTQKTNDTALNLAKVTRGEALTDLATLRSFLAGLKAQLIGDDAMIAQLRGQIGQLNGDISDVIDSLTAQSILSKTVERGEIIGEEHFAYWLVPNPMATTPSNIELLVRKDPRTKKINPDSEKQKIVLKLETEELGELGVSVEITKNKIWYIFHTIHGDVRVYIGELTPWLRDRMAALNYTLVGVQTTAKRVDTKKMLMPTLNLHHMSRVQTEV